MNNLDLTRWLLKVRDALAEQDEAKRNSMLRAADRCLKGNNQSLHVTGMDIFRRTGSPNRFDQPQSVLGIASEELTGPKKQLRRKETV